MASGIGATLYADGRRVADGGFASDHGPVVGHNAGVSPRALAAGLGWTSNDVKVSDAVKGTVINGHPAGITTACRCAPVDLTTLELLTNPTLDAGIGGWGASGTGAALVVDPSGRTNAGARLSWGVGIAPLNNVMAQPVSGLVIGRQYTFSAWLRNNDAAGQAARPAVRISGIVTGNAVSTIGVWDQSTVTFTATATTHTVNVANSGTTGGAAGTTSIDDLRLRTTLVTSGSTIGSINNPDGLAASAVVRGAGVWVFASRQANVRVYTGASGNSVLTLIPAGVWTYVKSGIPASGSAVVTVAALATVALVDFCYITGCIVSEAIIPAHFFDGDSLPDVLHDWEGPAGLSSSVEYGPPTPDDPANPTALSGLTVTWGRDSTVDQPAPGTCVFDLADSPGGQAFADVLATGTDVRVEATGTSYPAPATPTWADPGFEAAAPNVTDTFATLVDASTARAHSGTRAARLRPWPGVPRGVQATFAPAPFSPAGSAPAAWDPIPATAVGQRWTFGASVWAAAGRIVTVRAALFDGPYADAATVLSTPVLTVTGDGTWHVMAGSFTPTTGGQWVGLHVTGTVGRAWDDVPGSWDAATGTWDDEGAVFVDDVTILAPSGGTVSTVVVFEGRVTDLEAAWDEGITAPVLRVTAADFTSALGNRDVGDAPWPLEAMGVRFARIVTDTQLRIGVQVDPSVAAVPVSARDVDRQPAAGLLADLAASCDAVMWHAVHKVAGPYLWVEDPATTRPPAFVLSLVGGVVVIVDSTANALPLSACDVLRDPVTMRQNVGDVTTRVSVGWLEQPALTEHTVDLVDPAREGDGFGVRRYGLATQLTTAPDATAVADRILARTAAGWRAEGLTVDDGLPAPAGTDPTTETTRILTLLDGTARLALPIRLTDLPAWMPNAPDVGVYLEGGRYAFEDGRWVLELLVSNAVGAGADATWDDTTGPGWAWNTFDPSVTWNAMQGVGV